MRYAHMALCGILILSLATISWLRALQGEVSVCHKNGEYDNNTHSLHVGSLCCKVNIGDLINSLRFCSAEWCLVSHIPAFRESLFMNSASSMTVQLVLGNISFRYYHSGSLQILYIFRHMKDRWRPTCEVPQCEWPWRKGTYSNSVKYGRRDIDWFVEWSVVLAGLIIFLRTGLIVYALNKLNNPWWGTLSWMILNAVT